MGNQKQCGCRKFSTWLHVTHKLGFGGLGTESGSKHYFIALRCSHLLRGARRRALKKQLEMRPQRKSLPQNVRRYWHFLPAIQHISPSSHHHYISRSKVSSCPNTRLQLAALQEKHMRAEMLQVHVGVWAVRQGNPQITIPSVSH